MLVGGTSYGSPADVMSTSHVRGKVTYPDSTGASKPRVRLINEGDPSIQYELVGNADGTFEFQEDINTDVPYDQNIATPRFHLYQNYPNPFVGTTRILVVAFLCFLSLVTIALFILSLFLKKPPKDRRVYRLIRDTHQAFTHIGLPHLIIFILMRVFIQSLSGINLCLLCFFFSSELSLLQAIVAGSSAFFLGAISMVPMGLGVREASMLFYLHHMGISHEIGLSIVTIQRLLFTGLAFILGTTFGAILGVRNIKLDSAREKKNGPVMGSDIVD